MLLAPLDPGEDAVRRQNNEQYVENAHDDSATLVQGLLDVHDMSPSEDTWRHDAAIGSVVGQHTDPGQGVRVDLASVRAVAHRHLEHP